MTIVCRHVDYVSHGNELIYRRAALLIRSLTSLTIIPTNMHLNDTKKSAYAMFSLEVVILGSKFRLSFRNTNKIKLSLPSHDFTEGYVCPVRPPMTLLGNPYPSIGRADTTSSNEYFMSVRDINLSRFFFLSACCYGHLLDGLVLSRQG